MITREVEARLTALSGYQPGEIDQRTRPLRQHDLIPHGPRGINAPDLGPHHIALVILCMVARRAADGGPVAMRAMDLVYAPRPGCPLDTPMALAVAIGTAVTYGSAFCRRLEVACDGSLAWLEVVIEGAPYRLLFVEPDVAATIARHPMDYDATGAATCRHWFVMGPGAIDDIHIHAQAIDASPASGWTGRRTDASVEYGEPVQLDEAGAVVGGA